MNRPRVLSTLFGVSPLLALVACATSDESALSESDAVLVPEAPDLTGDTEAAQDTTTARGRAVDADGDGYDTSTDCNDSAAAVHPGATEADNLTDDDCDGYVDEGFVATGDLVITEINRQPRFGGLTAVTAGQWVEVYNKSARSVSLANWTFARGAAGNQVKIDPSSAPVVHPGERVNFCYSSTYTVSLTAAYPLTCAYVWGDSTKPASYKGTYHDNTFQLGANTDTVAIYANGSRTTGTLIDSVTWYYDSTHGYWPRNSRFSMSLSPGYESSTANDTMTYWCSTTADSSGTVSNNDTWRWYDTSGTTSDEYGTPGKANYTCQGLPDADGDGYSGSSDCNDLDATVNPGATETCNGVDDDCDGVIDDGTSGGTTTYYRDADGDSYGDASNSATPCGGVPVGYVTNHDDCIDTSSLSYPGATEICDGLDNNCDGVADEGLSTGPNTFYQDADGDGYGSASVTTTACTVPSGYAATSTDCDDTSSAINPGVAEADDLADNDCDGWVDEDFVAVGDLVVTEVNRQSRFGGSMSVNDGSWVEVYNASSSRTIDLSNWTLARGTSSSGNQISLDPSSAPVLAPGDRATFCDSSTYQSSATAAYPLHCDYVWGDPSKGTSYVGTYHDNTFYLRATADSIELYVGGSRTTGTKIDGVTWAYDATGGYWPRTSRFSMSLDPSYQTATYNDNVAAWCSTSSDSSGTASNNDTWRWYDTSGTSSDEYGTPTATNYDCLTAADIDGDGYTTATDCNDTDAAINPGATETCNGVDDDCDGTIDDGATDVSTTYPDLDADGYGDTAAGVTGCTPPSGYISTSGDCDDTSAAVHPGVTETCNGVDDDCNGGVDDVASGSTFYADVDGDGYGDDATASSTCSGAPGTVTTGGDCDDAASAVNPGVAEVCGDGIDNNCSGAGDCERSGSEKVSDNYDFRAYGTVASNSVGHTVANNGDFNGDGYDDVVVGQAYYDPSSVTDAGRFYLWNGPVNKTTDDGLSTADLTVDGDTSLSQGYFGSASSFVKDLDADGKDELLMGAWNATSSHYGDAYLFKGGTSPTSATSAYASFTSATANAYFGWNVDSGDVDGDGKGDVLVSGYNYSSAKGIVGFWKNTAVTAGAHTVTTDATFYVTGAASDQLGWCARVAGDIDGDGADDLLLGAPSSSATANGKVYLFTGMQAVTGSVAVSAADSVLSGAASGDRFGYALDGVGDVDHDGHNDFLVAGDKADTSATDAGAVYLFTSTPGSTASASTAATTITGEVASDFFGRTVSGVGDVNGDDYGDFVVGATAWDLGSISGAGAFYLWYGPVSSGTFSASGYDARFTGSNTTDAIGFYEAGGGDVNADGYDDFMASATSWDAFGLLNAGASWLWYGNGI